LYIVTNITQLIIKLYYSGTTLQPRYFSLNKKHIFSSMCVLIVVDTAKQSLKKALMTS